MLNRGSCRAEDRDFASALELLQRAKGLFQFANSLQGDLGIPAIKVVMGHAQHGQQHLAIECAVRAVGGYPLQLFVDLMSKIQPLLLQMQRQGIIGLVRHVLLLLHNILEGAATWAGAETQSVKHDASMMVPGCRGWQQLIA